MVGIYKIENLINHHIYIGQSINIEKRWKAEIASSKNSSDHSYDYPLQKAFRKYGISNFSFSIIEECQISELNDRERYWINFYNSFFDGYNQTLGGDARLNKPKEQIIGIITDLKTTDLIHSKIAEKWNVSTEMVQGINTGRYWFQENEIYPLRPIIRKKWYCQCGKEISKGATYCQECYNKIQQKVDRPSKEELEQYLFSIKGNFSEAGRHYGVSDNAVRKWCKKYELPTSSKNYK